MRDEHLLTLEEAIRKMTSRPAARVGLIDRGILRAGMMADITVFDPATIHDVATFEDPESLFNRCQMGAGQWPCCCRRRQDHRRASRPAIARPRLSEMTPAE
ncbi:MAG: amidohydrolase family protein [Acidobacteria bacterium]|nr:amidohydrolase family protein [Acidobacteriota bacterium]